MQDLRKFCQTRSLISNTHWQYWTPPTSGRASIILGTLQEQAKGAPGRGAPSFPDSAQFLRIQMLVWELESGCVFVVPPRGLSPADTHLLNKYLLNISYLEGTVALFPPHKHLWGYLEPVYNQPSYVIRWQQSHSWRPRHPWLQRTHRSHSRLDLTGALHKEKRERAQKTFAPTT